MTIDDDDDIFSSVASVVELRVASERQRRALIKAHKCVVQENVQNTSSPEDEDEDMEEAENQPLDQPLDDGAALDSAIDGDEPCVHETVIHRWRSTEVRL
jgi:hypothetical protein